MLWRARPQESESGLVEGPDSRGTGMLNLRRCVREALELPLLPMPLLLTVRTRGGAVNVEEERKRGREGEEEERDTTARLKGCIGFMQGRLT